MKLIYKDNKLLLLGDGLEEIDISEENEKKKTEITKYNSNDINIQLNEFKARLGEIYGSLITNGKIIMVNNELIKPSINVFNNSICKII